MSDKEFIKRYEELLDKDYCNCNEMNCIDNNSPRRILNIAKNFQQENKELKRGIVKIVNKRRKWKNKYYKSKKENKELKEALESKSYCKYANKCNEFDDCTKEEYQDLAEQNMKLSLRIDKAIKKIKKELEENNHLSYGVALTIINMLDGYYVLKGGK